jgi:2-methylaconitate cis-trans-isomerase PrpF
MNTFNTLTRISFAGIAAAVAASPAKITIEHPTGSIDVLAEYELSDDGFTLISAGLIRTARKLADGNLYIPAFIWENQG